MVGDRMRYQGERGAYGHIPKCTRMMLIDMDGVECWRPGSLNGTDDVHFLLGYDP
jgi:hypothetical protein